MIWIEHKQRTMKNYLRRIYNNQFTWKGVWRNKELYDFDSENVPVKVFNFVTKNLSKPILKTMTTQGLIYYDEKETQRIIKRENTAYQHNNWSLLECDKVFRDEIYQALDIRFFSRSLTDKDIDLLETNYVYFLEKFIFKDGKMKEPVL